MDAISIILGVSVVLGILLSQVICAHYGCPPAGGHSPYKAPPPEETPATGERKRYYTRRSGGGNIVYGVPPW